MKQKTLMRVVGIAQTLATSYFIYVMYNKLANTDYRKAIEVLIEDSPLEQKVASIAVLGSSSLIAILIVPITVGLADGLVDIYKGTHHYLFMQIGKHITRNPNHQAYIQKGIDEILSTKEEEIKFRR